MPQVCFVCTNTKSHLLFHIRLAIGYIGGVVEMVDKMDLRKQPNMDLI